MVSTGRIGQMHDIGLMDKMEKDPAAVDIMLSRIHDCGFHSPNWFCPDVPQQHQEYVHKYQSAQ